MKRIRIIEDDAVIRSELTTLLLTNGYMTVDDDPCDMILMDVNLPGESGFTLCRKLRQTSDTPVIFLTARDTPEDELLAFGVGGDDFIRKPYNSAVLLARIARILKTAASDMVTVRGLTLDLPGMRAVFGGSTVELTKNEVRILWCLMQKDICTREELIEDLWTNGMYIDGNTLYVNIGRLREKLGQIGATDFIRTVRGVGYRL
ncbi:MAG: response regulator transcription factor [Frisingicoccus sp.]|uniref:response regulator transcription factor n=1 Tax=Frisingicoccus sp. TaxID=1918627 RepID=UPI00262504D4|nr:response regulator transcription factor [Frisingicoccus sp.]MDD6233119.1 response regulator transcription factor [Frisingicoccus sp.]MDY4835036.1 response regulator transcription factor [Frisingicoccus sp.]